jgi:Fe-S cluster biosynthesis and repair protein YggX
MAQRTVLCVKLGRELPGLDEATPEGERALKMAQLLGGVELRQRVRDRISAEAWNLWKDYMLLVVNEFRLDPTSDAANAVLKEHMEAFLFGSEKPITGYVPPTK